MRKLCEDKEEFLPGIETHIVKDGQSSFLKRKMTVKKSSKKGPVSPGDVIAVDTTDILRKTKRAQDELRKVKKEATPAEKLHATFMTMIQL